MMTSKLVMADHELANYDFGEGVKVVGQDSWDMSDKDDFTKIVYVAFDDEPAEADSHRLSFHVRFLNGVIDDVYALSMDNGSDVGLRGAQS